MAQDFFGVMSFYHIFVVVFVPGGGGRRRSKREEFGWPGEPAGESSIRVWPSCHLQVGCRKPCRVTLPECCTAGFAHFAVRFSSNSMYVSQYFRALRLRVMPKSRNHAEKRNSKPAMYCRTDTDMKEFSGLERPEQACTFEMHRRAEN